MCKVMGIVNVTPDSFSDGGQFFKPEEAIRRAKNLIADGADIIDLGGESTRPGATPIGWEEEWSRIAPVLTGLTSFVSRLKSSLPLPAWSRSSPTAQTTFGATSASFATSTASAADSLRAGDPPTAISFSTPAAFARERSAAISVGSARSKWQCVS